MKIIKYGCTFLLVATLTILCMKEAWSVPIFTETFDTDAVGKAAFESAYTDFTFTGDEEQVEVASGVLRIGPTNNDHMDADINGFGGDILISGDVGALTGGGNYNVGMEIGDNTIVFHPGLSGGAFRVEGDGGFGNTNIGFTPAAAVLHHMEINVTAATGLFDITFTDGVTPSNIYTASFTNLSSVGGIIGFHRGGTTGTGIGLYDNLIVENNAEAVPEPTTIALLGIGLAGLAGAEVRRRRKKRAVYKR
ncbi:MAG: PEP-CTERM sorting domain-containing protein [Candidatus Brocadiales bacterium]|nr:PEP-CTERM sorting domain-containing protein [Candidatus Brocadiales bacterium]